MLGIALATTLIFLGFAMLEKYAKKTKQIVKLEKRKIMVEKKSKDLKGPEFPYGKILWLVFGLGAAFTAGKQLIYVLRDWLTK